MLVAILQVLFKFVLKLSAIFGLAFMVACTIFVIVCVIHGNIKINIIRNKDEKENEIAGRVICLLSEKERNE